jgi:methylamine dehydrogenase heavy chain
MMENGSRSGGSAIPQRRISRVSNAFASLLMLVLTASPTPSIADADVSVATEHPSVAPEHPSVATLPPVGDHWLWVPDRLLGHSLLFDADTGAVLGMIDSPLTLTPQAPIIATDRNEIYSVDIAYARGLRGDRTDFLTLYNLETLSYKDEIVFPTQAATANTSIAYSSRIGRRFFGVFNQFPATSISILDLDERRFVEEIGVAGCSGLYALDDLRFATLCGDGTVTVIELTSEGRKANLVRSEKFFDTLEDPVFTAAGRIGSRWVFVSFHGNVYDVDFSEAKPRAAPAWSLLGEDDAHSRSSWRPGGLQLVALHAASERLFVVMHEGGPGTHKDAGPEIWSFDLASRKRISRIEPPALAAAFLGQTLGLDPESLAATLLRWVLPADTIHSIAVSRDETPLLYMRNSAMGAIGVVQADDGVTVRILNEAGLFGPTLRVP